MQKKVDTDNNAPLELTIEMVINRGLERGISLQDWEILTYGMILDILISSYNERIDTDEEGEQVRIATQSDFDRF